MEALPGVTILSNTIKGSQRARLCCDSQSCPKDLRWWSGSVVALHFSKRNRSWLEMFPSFFRPDLLRNPEFAASCCFYRQVEQFTQQSKPSARPLHPSKFSHNSSIGPTPLSLHGTHTEWVGSCLWLNPGLLLMGVRCHCGGIKGWFTSLTPSVSQQSIRASWRKGQGTNMRIKKECHITVTHRSLICAGTGNDLETKICRFKIRKTVLHYFWRSRFRASNCRNQAALLHTWLFLSFVGLQILTHALMLTAGCQSAAVTILNAPMFYTFWALLVFMLGPVSVRKPMNDSATDFW